MPSISRLRVQNIRCHTDTVVDFSEDVTVITGKNGAGKTSILEALYLIERGSLFRGGDKDILQKEANWWRIDAVTLSPKTGKNQKTAKYQLHKEQKRKSFIINQKTYGRLPANFKRPVILFEPEDLRLVFGSPARRRLFIDRFISQLDKSYATIIGRYEKAIRQRNSLLQQGVTSSDQLFGWNVMVSDYGAKIIKARGYYSNLLGSYFNDFYNLIAADQAAVSLAYSPFVDLATTVDGADFFNETRLLTELNNNFEKDRLLGTTSVGPHRHDICFFYKNKPALKVVSRGESRTMVLALKLAELEVVRKTTGSTPLVLLDDVFSELDQDRQRSLANLTSQAQVVITSAHIPAKLPAHVITL